MKIALILGITIIVIVIVAFLVKPYRATSPTIDPTLPEATGYVVDTSHVLKPETVTKLNTELKALDNKAQIAVVTVDTTQPLSIEEYSIKLAEKWKPGYKGKDNGIIFLTAVKDRQIRIEVGRGLEGNITDAEAGRIISNVIAPEYKKGDWDAGVINGVEAMKKEL